VVTAFEEPPPLPHQGYFTKPFDTRELLAAVDRLHRARPGAEAR
jgi:DNA-binding response OmpR family regulator